ncbi:MAG: insulinase family protein [Deltaproteobacteria bacterium]|nr:insulinase family protein [Deltaproteobacteria bacterium]
MKYYKNILVILIVVGVLLLHTLAFGLSLEGRVKEYSLNNGMKILILERHFAPVVSLYMRFKVGAVDEAGGETGTAHLLEHMLFKGTETLGTRNYKEEKKILKDIDQLAGQVDEEMKKGEKADGNRIAELKERLKNIQQEHKKWVVKDEIDAIYSQNGAEGLNASTGYDITTYKVSLPANRIELWARIESDRISNPVSREFYSEREVVREERRQREETQPDGKLMENFLATAFVAHPYGRPIIGWDSDIKYLKRGRVKQIFRDYYCPNNAVVAVVGDVNPDEVMKTIERYFGGIPRQEILPVSVSEEPEQSGERRVEVEFEANPKMIIGYHKPSLPHFDDYVFDVIDILLSDGRTSRLYKKLVEERKIAVSVSTSNGFPGSRYANLFTVFATPRSPHTCDELEEEIYKQFDRLKEEAVTSYELNKVKNRLEASFIRSLNSNTGLAGRLSYYQTIAGDWRYIEEHLKVIEKVTPEDIMEVAKKYLIRKNRTVAQIVQKEDKD